MFSFLQSLESGLLGHGMALFKLGILSLPHCTISFKSCDNGKKLGKCWKKHTNRENCSAMSGHPIYPINTGKSTRIEKFAVQCQDILEATRKSCTYQRVFSSPLNAGVTSKQTVPFTGTCTSIVWFFFRKMLIRRNCRQLCTGYGD